MKRAVALFAFLVPGMSLPIWAQAPPDGSNDPSYQPQPAYQQQPPNGPRLSAQELSNLVAPIALYPDMLLSQVLAASTYPMEIQQAQQWLQQNRNLRGQQLVDAAKQQNWDPSVQALVAFPDVMNLLTRDIQWTTDLGNAFLSQQSEMMDSIQRLRSSARDNGRLTNTAQQRVSYEDQNVVIQPTDPQVVYPPVYNPEYVWGPPAYGYYPPLGYPSVGLGFGYCAGTFLGSFFAGLVGFGGWGWGLSWLGHGLFLNGLFFSHYGYHGYGGYGFHGGYGGYASRAAWSHDPGHRLGVPYGNRYSGARYSGAGGGRGWNGFSSNGRSSYNSGYNSGRAGSAGYSGSNYAGGNRQAQAYRGLTGNASRGGSYNSGYGAGYRGSGGASGYNQSRSASSGYRGTTSRSYAGAASSQGGYRGGYASGGGSPGRGWSAPSTHYSAPRSSGGGSHYSAPHYSAPKSSGGHSGGGGHSSGGGGGGGGHSHGGSHKR